MNVLGLVQLVDTTGLGVGYQECLSIETLARRGLLRTGQQVLNLVESSLRAIIGPTQGIAAGIAFRAARLGDPALVPAVSQVLSSEQFPESLRLASLQMGTRLWEISRRWNWTQPIHDQFDPVIPQTGVHGGVAFGALVSETTAHEVRAVAACLLQAARGIIQAAVRAIPLDDYMNHRLLAQAQPIISRLAADFTQHTMPDIRCSQFNFPMA